MPDHDKWVRCLRALEALRCLPGATPRALEALRRLPGATPRALEALRRLGGATTRALEALRRLGGATTRALEALRRLRRPGAAQQGGKAAPHRRTPTERHDGEVIPRFDDPMHRAAAVGRVVALAYNTIGIPVAAAGFLAPWLAGAAMALSSVSVTLNALRLQRVKLK